MEYGFCSLLGWSSSHTGIKLWFWTAGETQCITHHSYTILAEVLKIVVEYVNYMQTSVMKHCIFKKLCYEMDTEVKSNSVPF